MKKLIAAVLALSMCMMLVGAVTAETADSAGTVTESTPAPADDDAIAEGNDFLDWIGQGVEMISGAVTEGFAWLQEKSGEWIEKAEAYMESHQWDRKVEEAWETLKQGAAEQGTVAKEKLVEAYDTVKTWITDSGDAADQAITEAVDGIAAAAGVAEAKVSSWYRMMEAYMTEKADLVTDAAREAWETICQSASEAGSVAREELDKACDTFGEWLESIGEDEDSDAVQGLELVKEQI